MYRTNILELPLSNVILIRRWYGQICITFSSKEYYCCFQVLDLSSSLKSIIRSVFSTGNCNISECWFVCVIGEEEIPFNWQCDGYNDCMNGLDEGEVCNNNETSK